MTRYAERRARAIATFGAASLASMMIAAGAAGADPASGPPGGGEGWSGSVGIGAGAAPDYEGSDDYTVIPLPNFELSRGGYGVKTNRLGLEADLTPSRSFNAGPILRYQFGRDDDVEDSRVSRLDEVDPSIELGGFVSYAIPNLTGTGDVAVLRLSAVQDVADGHGGFVAEASAGYVRPVTERLSAGAFLGATYASEDYMDAFFGVSAAEAARSGLSASDADGGLKDVGVTVVLDYALTDSWSLNGVAGYKRLLGDAADSAVTDEAGSPDQAFGGLGFSYDF
ncbi:MAG: MipA/OmpV family protein [Pseudomonadota bacterium]